MEKPPSSASRSPHFNVAIEGFSSFESDALASYFRLAVARQPAYRVVSSLREADFVIADADHAEAIDAVRRVGRERETVFVGAEAPPGALAWLHRPIEPTRIVRELDNLVSMRPRAAAAPAEPARAAEAPPGEAPPATGWREGRAGGGRDVLVVEDSAIARKFLAQRLQRLGYRVHAAGSGELAMELLKLRPFTIVFLDVQLGPPGAIDGLRICQFVKQRSDPPQGLQPAVIMVSGLSGAMDKVRGSLAGCDAYLTKPLDDDELKAALRKLDPAFVLA